MQRAKRLTLCGRTALMATLFRSVGLPRSAICQPPPAQQLSPGDPALGIRLPHTLSVRVPEAGGPASRKVALVGAPPCTRSMSGLQLVTSRSCYLPPAYNACQANAGCMAGLYKGVQTSGPALRQEPGGHGDGEGPQPARQAALLQRQRHPLQEASQAVFSDGAIPSGNAKASFV